MAWSTQIHFDGHKFQGFTISIQNETSAWHLLYVVIAS